MTSGVCLTPCLFPPPCSTQDQVRGVLVYGPVLSDTSSKAPPGTRTYLRSLRRSGTIPTQAVCPGFFVPDSPSSTLLGPRRPSSTRVGRDSQRHPGPSRVRFRRELRTGPRSDRVVPPTSRYTSLVQWTVGGGMSRKTSSDIPRVDVPVVSTSFSVFLWGVG